MLSNWAILALISAFSLATSDALTKKALQVTDEYIVAFFRLLFSLPILIIVLLAIQKPSLDIYFYLSFICAIPLEIVAMVLYVKALKLSPMSLTLPFLSLTPVFLIFTSYILVNERVSLQGFVGIMFIAVGGYILNLKDIKKGLFGPVKSIMKERGTVYMIFVAFIYSITSSLGKIAIEHSSPLYFGATYFLALTICFSLIIFKSSIADVKIFISSRKFMGLILPGIFYSIMIITHMLAMDMAKVSYMISVKRLSIMISVIYGFLLFKEEEIAQRFMGALLMFVGFVLIVNAR